MSQFYINPGELRTKIRIQKQVTIGTGSFATKTWIDIGNVADTDPPKYIMAKWEGLKGIEKWTAESLQAIDSAIITVRYNASINAAYRVLNSGTAYQIIDITDPTQHKQWLLITIRAGVMG